MKIKYIAIEREYGSGGSEIAERVAKECGISCYGSEILEIAANNQGISVEEARDYEEKATNSFLYSAYMMSQVQSGNVHTLPNESRLHIEEQLVIQSLAHKGAAVFVGHCASEALKDVDGVLRVFIRADENFEKQRAVAEYGIAEKDAEAVCRKNNKRRANYYAFNTSSKWDDIKNYDLILDSSRIGIDGCVKAIVALMK